MIDLIWKVPLGALCATWAWAIWKIIRGDDKIYKRPNDTP